MKTQMFTAMATGLALIAATPAIAQQGGTTVTTATTQGPILSFSVSEEVRARPDQATVGAGVQTTGLLRVPKPAGHLRQPLVRIGVGAAAQPVSGLDVRHGGQVALAQRACLGVAPRPSQPSHDRASGLWHLVGYDVEVHDQ